MKDDRTCRSERYWDEGLEGLGLPTQPFVVSGADLDLAEAIDHAISAGACRIAGKARPECAATWNAVADAKSRQAREALTRWLTAQGG